MGEEISPKLQKKLELFVYLLSFLVILCGLTTLAGWFWDIRILKSIYPTWVTMKVNPAISLLFFGAALLATQKQKDKYRKGLVLFPGLIGAMTLLEYAFNMNFGIDELLFKEPLAQLRGLPPGRMAPNTALVILILAAALYFMDYENSKAKRPAQYLALLAYILTLPPLIIYFYRISFIHGMALFTEMAVHTALATFFLATGILCLRPNKGFVATLFANSPSGLMLRELVPAAIGVPLAFGLMALTGARAEFYDLSFALTLSVLACIVTWCFVLSSTAKQLMQIDHARLQIEEEKLKLTNQRESERVLFQTILETIPSAVVVGEAPTGKLVFANSQVVNVWRQPMLLSNSVEEYQVWKAFHSDGSPYEAMDWPLARTILRGETVLGEDTDVLRGDGTRGIIRLSSAPIKNAEGKITAGVVICEDVTELKRAEEERVHFLAEQQSAEAIKHNEIRLRSIFDSAFEGIVTNDEQGVITDWNPKAENIFSIRKEEALGQKIYELIIPPKYRESFKRDTKKFFETGYGPLLNKTIEIEAIRKNGEIFPIQLSVSAVKKDGRFMFTSFIDDITLRKRNERELISAKQAALDAAKAKSEFLANMSHEMRTPLNGIIGLTDLLYETPLDAEQSKFARLIHDSGANLLTIINDILDFSKIDAGRLNFENIEFNVETLIKNTAELLHFKALEKGLKLNTQVEASVPKELMGDPGRLGQVVVNLLGNAIKFTEQGSIDIHVKIKNNDPKNPKLYFSVTDTGIGISQESVKKLFNAFVQADGTTTRKYGGTGLGLSICKKLVELMQGEFGVESEIGKGSTFWFTATFQSASEFSEKIEEAKILPFPKLIQSKEVVLKKSLRILVAEDNSTNQLLTLSQLKSLGYSAQAVANGLEAVESFKTKNFDLILMDCQMPEMDGFEATRTIRQLENSLGTHIPIIALTANAMKEDEVRCRAVGMDDYLSKPIKKERLGEKLLQWSENKDKKVS